MNIRDVKKEDFSAKFKGELEELRRKQPDIFDETVNFILSGGCQSAAFEQDGELMGIMQWIEYAPRCVYVAVFPTEAIIKHNVAAARLMKKFMYHTAKCYQCVRMETLSVDNDFLNKWHRFLGFDLEGKRRKYMFGVDYNMWGVLFDGN